MLESWICVKLPHCEWVTQHNKLRKSFKKKGGKESKKNISGSLQKYSQTAVS